MKQQTDKEEYRRNRDKEDGLYGVCFAFEFVFHSDLLRLKLKIQKGIVAVARKRKRRDYQENRRNYRADDRSCLGGHSCALAKP